MSLRISCAMPCRTARSARRFSGTAKLILEGCDGVIEYETEKIGLRCGRRAVWVEGKSLRLLCLEEDGAVITGHIEAVRFA